MSLGSTTLSFPFLLSFSDEKGMAFGEALSQFIIKSGLSPGQKSSPMKGSEKTRNSLDSPDTVSFPPQRSQVATNPSPSSRAFQSPKLVAFIRGFFPGTLHHVCVRVFCHVHSPRWFYKAFYRIPDQTTMKP